MGEDGSFLCPDGDAYLLYCLLPYEAVRALDSVLDAYWSWNTPYQETVLPPEPTEDEQVRAIAAGEEALEQADRLNAMLDDLYANPDVFYEWMRTCFVRTIGFLGQQLEEGTLVLEASFTDGSYERHGYGIGLTDDYEEAAADRFDALVESSPYDIAAGETLRYETADGRREWSFDNLPFGFFLDGQPFDDAAEADPRLSRPVHRGGGARIAVFLAVERTAAPASAVSATLRQQSRGMLASDWNLQGPVLSGGRSRPLRRERHASDSKRR